MLGTKLHDSRISRGEARPEIQGAQINIFKSQKSFQKLHLDTLQLLTNHFCPFDDIWGVGRGMESRRLNKTRQYGVCVKSLSFEISTFLRPLLLTKWGVIC